MSIIAERTQARTFAEVLAQSPYLAKLCELTHQKDDLYAQMISASETSAVVPFMIAYQDAQTALDLYRTAHGPEHVRLSALADDQRRVLTQVEKQVAIRWPTMNNEERIEAFETGEMDYTVFADREQIFVLQRAIAKRLGGGAGAGRVPSDVFVRTLASSIKDLKYLCPSDCAEWRGWVESVHWDTLGSVE